MQPESRIVEGKEIRYFVNDNGANIKLVKVEHNQFYWWHLPCTIDLYANRYNDDFTKKVSFRVVNFNTGIEGGPWFEDDDEEAEDYKKPTEEDFWANTLGYFGPDDPYDAWTNEVVLWNAFGKYNEQHAMWETQRAALQKAHDNPEIRARHHSPLGVYSNNGNNSRVTLFIDAIRNKVGDPCKATLLMAQVLHHGYFHSFYAHVGIGEKPPLHCVEGPMAEFGSRAFLLSMSSSRSSVARQVGGAMRYAIDLALARKKSSRASIGGTYRYGVHLFENFCGYYPDLIARYANVSSLLDDRSREAIEFKYMLYPTYPTSAYVENVVL